MFIYRFRLCYQLSKYNYSLKKYCHPFFNSKNYKLNLNNNDKDPNNIDQLIMKGAITVSWAAQSFFIFTSNIQNDTMKYFGLFINTLAWLVILYILQQFK